MTWKTLLIGLAIPAFGLVTAVACFTANGLHGGDPASGDELGKAYVKSVQPLLRKYCFDCHSKTVHKGDLDLERFESLNAVRKDVRPWQHLIEQVEVGEMPPKAKPQPSGEERKLIVTWARAMLDAEARSRTGDPGRVPLRRLSNAEYDATIRDLTGIDLKPTREFPADGAAGEGFTNAAESLSDITPTLFTRYLNAAKDIADHAVLLPEGFRFSLGKTRRDWTDESVARLRKFYGDYSNDGRLAIQPYLLATIRHRDSLAAGKLSLAEVAVKEKLNAKYLGVLWQTLTDKTPSALLDRIRTRWRDATEKEGGPLAAEIAEWQAALWNFVAVGSYRAGADARQVANDPVPSESSTIKLAVKPALGQSEIALYLTTNELSSVGKDGRVVWHRPRFEGAGKAPLLLKDYPQFGIAFEINRAAVFADTARYLAAALEIAHDKKLSADEFAGKANLNPAFLKRWVAVLALEPAKKETVEPPLTVPAVALELLDQRTPKNDKNPSIRGWRRSDADLPILITNASDTVQQIPGTVSPHRVVVHPTPKEFVAVAWKSPLAGKVDIAANITHAHPACGNGVAWWLEHRRDDKSIALAEGSVDRGGKTKLPNKTLDIQQGDRIVIAVDARDNDHFCDLTEVGLTITESTKGGRVWDLAADVADKVQDANPHADKFSNLNVWSFVRGATKALGKTSGKTKSITSAIPPSSVLGHWRVAAADPARRADADKLATLVQTLLTNPPPGNDSDTDRVLFESLVSVDGMLLKGLDVKEFTKAQPHVLKYGLPSERFSSSDGKPGEESSLVATANSVIEIRLPAALFRDREFVVEGKFDGAPGERIGLFQVTTTPPARDLRWNGKSPVAASPNSTAYKQMIASHADFRRAFPWYLCFPNVVPTDEVVSLKMFHREDEPLERLFLDAEQKRRLDHLWDEHRFISQQALAENNYLPQFIGYVTQDQPKALLDYFESQRPAFKKRSDESEKIARNAEPKQLAALAEFASRAYRRPLHDKEKAELLDLYQKLRKKDVSHDEAFRGVLTRILVAPPFLFRVEKAPPGLKAGLIDDWELATRLSYFLWSSTPDDELRRLAAAGQLHDPKTLAEQTRRMLKDERLRSMAIEFGTQWIHVRDFDSLKEKNEKLFPTFTPALRKAIYEESILFFLDLFQADRSVTQILDADATYLDETLAKHYGIPGVTGTQWRRVEGVRKYGRGGILGLASVHAKQSGASRTSPVLRGNWVVETLLGEKLPRPPANVPILPDEEGGADKQTTRQQLERHVSDASCTTCHVRIDPFGFAFENFDAIGRWRVKETSGLPVDTKAKLRDGTEFAGIDGLREHLLTKKKDVIVRLFCQRLLGYALGRATTLSDTSLIDEMIAELNKNDGRLSAAILTIIRSPQFQRIRGGDVAHDE